MKIFNNCDGNYHEDPIRNLNFTSNDNLPISLYYGIGAKLEKDDTNMKFYLELEEPNRFFCSEAILKYKKDFIYYDKILTLCPYTADFLNKHLYKRNQSHAIFFPFDKNFIPTTFEKKYNIIYSGYTRTNYHDQMLSVITKFPDHAIICFQPYKFVTHVDATYKDKINLFSQSKIAVMSNLIFNDRGITFEGMNSASSNVGLNNLQDNAAFKYLESHKIAPQLKSRVFEAAFGKCVILCQKDFFNVIERYFTPEKEFLYFDDLTDLEAKIKMVLANYDHYSKLGNNAFERATNNYTTDHLIEKIHEIYSNDNNQ
jgi:glycosyltransferase involved in cell wall biosynthesis